MRKKRLRRTTPQLCLTIPQSSQDQANKLFVETIDREIFIGIPSLSKVVTALLDIAIEEGNSFNPENITNTDELKEELRRVLANVKYDIDN